MLVIGETVQEKEDTETFYTFCEIFFINLKLF